MSAADPEASEETEELDALRRRLYRPDATDADLARYRATAPMAEAEPPEPDPEPEPTPAPEPVARRTLGLALGAVVVVALIGTAVLLGRTHSTPGTPRATAVAAPAAAATELAIPASQRVVLTRSLNRHVPLLLSHYFFDHPDGRPTAISTVERGETEEYQGTGSRAIDLDPSAIAAGGGRATVILLLARSADARWTALRSSAHQEDRYRFGVLAERAVHGVGGLPTATTFPYNAPAPTRLTITVAPDVLWDAVVIFTD